ncbi:MAG: DUF1622 domain-containing protein [Flavobacteriaceae bacterium TMED81]|jgi:uncharacterized membrane protein|nr:MAG: DUF1622 domain-containing protein [Flavobacteriaceae bacterium TMED81]|tara:strand:+ start:536 stop:916 length:381 start_codon:yes stop_codon:yes gene_type:complete
MVHNYFPNLIIMDHLVIHWVNTCKLIIETIGALLVCVGCILSIRIYLLGLFKSEINFSKVRLTLARYLMLALEFQLGADILGTAVSPNWDTIGKLAAIAVIRTLLNHFLSKEIDKEEQHDSRKVLQ